MSAWALPILVVGGSQVVCQHRDGIRTHPWTMVDVDGYGLPVVLCADTLRVYVHKAMPDIFEKWVQRHPGQAMVLPRQRCLLDTPFAELVCPLHMGPATECPSYARPLVQSSPCSSDAAPAEPK